MKNEAEKLEILKALTPGGIDPCIAAGGAKSDWPTTVSGALARLPKLIYLFAMHTHVYQRADYDDLTIRHEYNELINTMMIHFRDGGFPPWCCYAISKALVMAFRGPTDCARCNGKGYVINTRKERRKCWRCKVDGEPTGLQRYTHRELARAANVAPSTWLRKYEKKYYDAVPYANTWLAVAAATIVEQVRGEAA